MALRIVRVDGDPVLRKKSKKVRKLTERTKILIDDMLETMYHEQGVGLAAPQVGVLKRIIVIDVGDGPLKLINPEIIDEEGNVIDMEGCLSVPGKYGKVERPEKVKVRYIDENEKEKTIKAEGLLARALCHEIDHLDGVLYTDKVLEYVDIVE